MKKSAYTLVLALLACTFTFAQQNKPLDLEKKRVAALRIDQAPTLDGRLDEVVWQQAEPARDLIQLEPRPGNPATQASDIMVLYDNVGLYVGAKLYDARPDSIQRELVQRDQIGNAEWFGIFLDAYRDGINGFGFIVTSANVQFDAKYSTFGEDPAWDAVWDSRVQIDDEGWTVEMHIPYSAIRFPEQAEQTWHVNFGRFSARKQEKNFWSFVDPQKNGFLNQAGYLTGVRDVKSPVRLQATPFVAVYGLHHHDNSAEKVNSLGHSFNGGMDVKVGLSDAFTLDMTLIPDFGEAQSDNRVLNLSPFEVRFDENRAFFTEGTELFNKGDLFYSRRVGGTPINYWEVENQLGDGEEILENPQQTQLFNATKISGRSVKGTGLGFFNATSGRTYARVGSAESGERRILTDPLTNYNVFVLDQNLPHNSYATLINTTVLREGDDYDANVTGLVFQLQNKKNSYALEGGGALSQIYNPGSTDLGHRFNLGVRKTSGNVVAMIRYSEESDSFNPNDLGFNTNNNKRIVSGFVEYNRYKPFWVFNRGGFGTFQSYNRLYRPDAFTSWEFEVWTWAQDKNFWRFNVWSYNQPIARVDYFEPRVNGRYWRDAAFGSIGYFISTDTRKRLQLQVNGNFRKYADEGRSNVNFFISPRYRVNNHFNVGLELFRGWNNRDVGFVNSLVVEQPDPVNGGMVERTDVIFGRRDRTTVEAGLRANYTFTANMSLSMRLRHYWSKVKYEDFHLLEHDGDLGKTDYEDLHDGDFDAFNIDLVYRWRFAPGSDIYVVWKNNISSYYDQTSPTYWDNLNGLWREPQSNSLSLKVIYFLDYARIFRE